MILRINVAFYVHTYAPRLLRALARDSRVHPIRFAHVALAAATGRRQSSRLIISGRTRVRDDGGSIINSAALPMPWQSIDSFWINILLGANSI